MNTSKITLRLLCQTAVIFLLHLFNTVNGQISNSGFENQLSGWIHEGASISYNKTILSWTVSSAETKMAEVIPAALDAESAAIALQLPLSYLAWPDVTNFGILYQDIFLGKGQTVTMWWNFLSEDRSPYDDGCFASLSCPDWQDVQVLVRTSTDGIVKASGKFGASGWHSVTFEAPYDGVYRLGFGVFNHLDEGNNAHLFIDNADGGTSAPGYPIVSTSPISNPDESSLVAGGSVTKAGVGSITVKGIVYGTSPNPVINGSGVEMVNAGSGLGTYTCNLTGLLNGITYYIRAFATNSSNLTSYGGTVSYTSISMEKPTVVTQSVNGITNSTATVDGAISNDGGSPVTAKGFVWNSSGNPTLDSYLGITDQGTGSSSFFVNLDGLQANTTYFVKAYATNGSGTGYGSQITFRTAPDAPILLNASKIGQQGFTANWNPTPGAIAYFMDVSTDESFSVMLIGYDNRDVGDVTSAFITGLNPTTNYYFRVRAFNGDAISQNSNIMQVTTSALHHFQIEAADGENIGPQIAGIPFFIKISALDANEQIIPDFSGSVILSSIGNPIQGIETDNFIDGILGSHQVVLAKSGSDVSITASTGEATGTSNTFAVDPSDLAYFKLVVHPDGNGIQQPVTAGTTFGVRVTAFDPYDNLKTNYVGNQLVSWSTTATSSPGGTSVNIPESGGQNFIDGEANITGFRLFNAGEQPSITIIDDLTSSSGTTEPIIVQPAPLDHFMVEPEPPEDMKDDGFRVRADEKFSVKVTACDQFKNTKYDYSGNIHFKSPNDTIITYPEGLQQYTSGNGDHFNNGVRIFENAVSISVPGNYWLGVADFDQPTITGMLENILVEPPAPVISYRMSNPRIYSAHSFEFDVEAKSSEEVFINKGIISFNFNDQTFGLDNLQWSTFKGPVIAGNTPLGDEEKYDWNDPNPIISGNNAVFGFNAEFSSANGDEEHFNRVTTDWQTVMTVRIPLISGQAINLGWEPAKMEDSQFYQEGTNTVLFSKVVLEDISFSDIYLERLYTISHGWQEQGGGGVPDFSVPKLTSILNGNITIESGWLASDLRIHPEASLTLAPTSTITVNGVLDIQAEDGLLIQSDANGSGSLVASSVTGMGSAKIQRFLAGNAWHLLSSPVSVQSITDFLGSNGLIPEKDGLRGFTTYNTTHNAWNPMLATSSDGYLNSGAGYLARTSSNGIVEFRGQIVAGDQMVPVSASGSGWNLVGNPYTSGIHINAMNNSFLDLNKHIMDPAYMALYVWDESYSTSNYRVINYLTDPYMASVGQGFLIKAKESGTIGFNASLQAHPTTIRQKSATIECPIARITLYQADKQAFTDIVLAPQATIGLDPGYDAGLLKLDTDFSIFTRMVEDNGHDYMIQAIPLPDEQSLAIPLGLICESGMETQLTATLSHFPSHINAEIFDRQSSESYPIQNNEGSVSFQTNSSSPATDRFVLLLSDKSTDALSEPFEPAFRVYQNHEAIVMEGPVNSGTIIRITDLQGRVISEFSLHAGTYHRIPSTDLRTGVYLFQLLDKDQVRSFKIPVVSR